MNDILGQVSLEARRTRGAESSPRPAACYDSRRYPTMVTRLVEDMFALSVALSAALLDPRQCRPQAPRSVGSAVPRKRLRFEILFFMALNGPPCHDGVARQFERLADVTT